MCEVKITQQMGPHDPYKLARLRVAPSTLRGYNRDLEVFLSWGERKTGKQALTSAKCYDRLLNEFAIHVYEKFDGRKRQLVMNAKCALELHFPQLKGKLELTHTSLVGWLKQVPFQQTPVCPWEIAALMSRALCRQGHLGASVAIILAFDCYLRVGELTGLRAQDVLFTGDSVEDNVEGAVVVLRATKTGRNQSVLVRNKAVIDFLYKRVKVCNKHELIFGLTARQFGARLTAAGRSLGIEELAITAHSLRYGGACFDYIRGSHNIEAIATRGRWASMKQLRRYLQPGGYYKQLELLPRSLLVKAERHAAKLGVRTSMPDLRP